MNRSSKGLNYSQGGLMKGKITKLMMVAMMLVTVFGMVASLATVASTATVAAATDKWSRMDLPTTLNYQMLPDSEIWDLTGAADGTLFALVEDTTGTTDVGIGAMVWDGERWAVYPAYSDIAVFKSTDGGCSWSLMWHVPASETGAPIAIVPQPGYVDSDSTKDTVFVAMGSRFISGTQNDVGSVAGGLSEGNIYRSMDAAKNFTRVTPRCPGVTAGGTITSMDVVQCAVCATGCQDPNMVIVGVSSLLTSTGGAGGHGEGVYTWNQNGIALWNDLQVSNSMVVPVTPGTMAAGNMLDVIQVYGSRNYPTDGLIVAVVNDLGAPGGGIDPANEPAGIYVCFYDANDGIWGGDIDSPTNARHANWLDYVLAVGVAPDNAGAASIDTGTDFSSVTACYVFVGFDGTLGNDLTLHSLNDDVWRVRGLSTVTGPSTVVTCNVMPLLASGSMTGLTTADPRISDIMINGEVSNPQTGVMVGCEYPAGQAQQLSVYNALVWPGPVPSFKPTSGGWPVFITDAAANVYAAGGGDGSTNGGVHKYYQTTRGPVFNGRGLLDDIAVSEDIPAYTGHYSLTPTSWCMAEAVSEEVSPTYATDGLIYVATWSEWTDDLSLWRLTDGCWERIMFEDIRLPGGVRFDAKNILTNIGQYTFANDMEETWWPRVVPQFSTDQSMFLLGGRSNWTDGAFGGSYVEMCWYSPDKGNDWRALPQMPIGAHPLGAGLSESGWWVQDSNTIFLGDDAGWIYKTTNRGASWTEGVLTGDHLEITSIRTSPIYSETGAAGTDKCVLAGTYDQIGHEAEVWLSQDGCYSKDLENVGDPIYVSPSWGLGFFAISDDDLGGAVVNFDKNWATNKFVYAAGQGYLDTWQLVGTGSTQLTRIAYSDVSVVRTVVDLIDPSAATWEHQWDAQEWNDLAPKPQPLPQMTEMQTAGLFPSIHRIVVPSALEIGPDGTVYVAFALGDMSYNTPAENPTPNWIGGGAMLTSIGGRFTMGGVLRCLDGTLKTTEWENCQDGRGPWDGLWLGKVVAGTNHIISLNFDWKEWRFKLAFWEDTLSGVGPAPVSPLANATGVGALVADTSVNVPLSWQAKGGASLYEWQVSEDSAFTASNTKTGTTSDLTVTVLDLKPSTTYFWRSRALEPMLGRWNTAQQFTTVIGGDTGAPKLITPEIGATISDDTPLFTWAGIASVTNYQVQVATSPTFAAADIVIDESLGNVNAYEADKELVNGTYYWQVKGTNATTDTETPWSALGSFTLDTEAGGTGTPVWVWVLIVLGVLLGIVVLVLILRTRRPV
jgi:hypothetical protein